MIKLRLLRLKLLQYLLLGIDWVASLVMIEIIITCNYCLEELELSNVYNHVSFHNRKGDKPIT